MNVKIQKYIQKYNQEKNNIFCMLSSKIGVDVIPMINAYLSIYFTYLKYV
jgi:hypothetical protein